MTSEDKEVFLCCTGCQPYNQLVGAEVGMSQGIQIASDDVVSIQRPAQKSIFYLEIILALEIVSAKWTNNHGTNYKSVFNCITDRKHIYCVLLSVVSQ